MTILITDSFHPSSLKIFPSSYNIIRTSDLPTNKNNICAILTRSKTQIDNLFIKQLPNLKFIATATSGLDHIDLLLCQKLNIQVFNPKEVNSISAAEHSFSILLSLIKNLKLANDHLLSDQWKVNLSRGNDLFGKSIGIIGLGRVGSKVAQIAKAFSMKVSAYDPYKSENYFKEINVKKINKLDTLLQNSNIISLHTPLTKETTNLLNKNNLKLISNNSILINTARGDCIQQDDLYTLLVDKPDIKAGLDVFKKEPLKADPLQSLPNVFLTPHIGAYTHEAFKCASFECTTWLYNQLN